MRRVCITLLATGMIAGAATTAEASNASLRGSRSAMELQNRVAQDHGLAFYRTGGEIEAAVKRGELMDLPGSDDYDVADFVRYPYVQPAVKLFIERLAAQYHAACGQKLVVTSAVRPSSGQPSNAHALSVHPAGMAVDLRVSDRAECREWLENAILSLESNGVLNGIREYHPPHYHVAVFPEAYLAYVEPLIEAERVAASEAAAAAAAQARVEAEAVPLMASATAGAGPNRSRAVPLAATLFLLLLVPLGTRAVMMRRGSN